ncbi:MAG: single-stranded DNA-binding protein [Anaerolineae bacterium]|jgi:single-strand DNA-binding protein|nr:single-stranded DNA-binding protein [Anaerolineae bacterium]
MYHTIILIGNLGRDPELRYIPSGQAVTTLNVASNRNYKGSDGEMVKETIWFRVSVWGKQAETVSQYLHKGSKVLVEGRLQPDPASGGPRLWTDKEGNTRASFEVTASTVRFLSSKGEGGGMGEDGEMPAGGEEEIPF